MMWSQPRKQSTSSSHNEVEFLNLCKTIVKGLLRGGNLLNQRQCQDLASKLSRTAQNVKEVVLSCGGSSPHFRPALEDLYRYFEKAKVLVRKCGDQDWCAAAVFQSQNENAFRDILLDVGLCYNAIYEQAKRKSGDRIDLPHDLRQSSVFEPTPDSDVDRDKQDLLKRLDEQANGHTLLERWKLLILGLGAQKQRLAEYLLLKMECTSKESKASILNTYSAILLKEAFMPSGTWGNSTFLGGGSGADGVCRTSWLGISCAKKVFHGEYSESFFLKEAGILAHLKHPCIVNMICCGNGLKKGERFIALELMEKSLFDLIEEQKEQKGVPFSVPVAVDMMVQIARGVCYLHDRGVAHRDLKPQNVVVSRLTSPNLSEDHFSVKLVDFGISKTKVEVSKSNTMTAGGIGTTRYRAPEVFPQAHRSGIRKANWLKADVYSFAMTCAHLLSLKRPFEELQNDLRPLHEKLVKGERPKLPVGSPKELVELLEKCWNFIPGSRPLFNQICVELEKFRHALLRGYGGANEGVQDIIADLSAGFDFIGREVDKQSAIHAPLVNIIDEEDEELLYDGERPSQTQLNILKLCKTIVEDLARGGNLLNQRQCQDLASKLSRTVQNVGEVVSSLGGSSPLFQPALENLYRYFEKAKVLVSKCGDEDWCAAAVFQSQNENAFRDILLDVGLCYNAIYEQAKRKSDDRIDLPHDLRQSSVFEPASDSDVDADKQDLLKRLDDLANGHSDIKGWDKWISGRGAQMQSIAKYLLLKMYWTSKEHQADILDSFSAMLWTEASEPSGTWGRPRFLGAGSGASGVCCTTWHGIPCAKKVFHGQDSETSFMKEAGILAHLKHPCIVNLICCGTGLKKGDCFIAMELMEMSLFDLIEEQKGVRFSLPVAVDMMMQIARGVCYLHDRGVAHRDLKPQNVVVSRLICPHLSEVYFTVKLVDFGMSKTKVEVSKSNTMTAAGTGTTRYRAPEVFPQAYGSGTGKANWFKADVYSFAMTCAHLLSLKSPFEAMLHSLRPLHEKLVKGERPELPVDCPKELVGLLEKCWSTRPGSRPSFMQTCVELEKLRHAFFSGHGGAREGVQDNIVDMSAGFDFIKGNVDMQTAPLVEEDEGLLDAVELPILACAAGHALEFLPQVPSSAKFGRHCNLCWEDIVDEHYHCRSCDFDAHSHCSRLEIKVNVIFHKHPLQLLVRSYYNGDPDAVCCFCEESLQHSEWVYRCEQCDFDMHAHCTKHPEEIMHKSEHPHRLTLRQCPPGKCLTCARCNGEVRGITWRYTCTERWCTLDAHPSCVVNSNGPLCVFDKGHRFSLIRERRGFFCGSCGGFGYSWYYHCDGCDVNIHLDCAYDMEEEDNWIEVYEQFKAQYMTKEDLTQISVDTISRLLDELRVSDRLGGSSLSASRPKPVVEGSAARVQPTIRRVASCDTPDVDAIDFDDADLRKQIVAETAGRKAKRMRAKAGRLELKGKYLEMLGDLESTVGKYLESIWKWLGILDLQSSKRVLLGDGEALQKVRKCKDVVEDEMATLVQSRVRQFGRTGVFFLDRTKERGVLELLTSLQADMVDVRLMFLCEEPGHEHNVKGSFSGAFDGALGEEREGILKPLLARGLEVVAKAMSASLGELSPLDSLTLPILGSRWRWDLGAIDVEKHGKVSKDKENVEELKRAKDLGAEWLLRDLEIWEDMDIYRSYGLLRIRYKVTEEGDIPRYTRGSVAWLCKDHVYRGLKDGILESYPLKYYNPQLN
ncbi:hypothetical protein M758_5G146300 [Ceratodon purpureus]|nr:hypothetical protein M758_5G146300 [Ceratodon purpureus]